MSHNRKEGDKQKVNNYVAKHDHNRGGFHGKSKKAQRSQLKSSLNQIPDDLYDESKWDDDTYYQDYD